MEIKLLGKEEKDAYELFVKANGSFLQSWDWGEFQEKQNRKVYRFLFLENNMVAGAAQAVLNSVNKKSYLFFPNGPVCPAESLENVLKCLKQEVKKHFPGLVFLRIEPQFVLHGPVTGLKKSVDIDPHKTLVLDLTKDEVLLTEEMHNKTRYNIKVAQKRGVEIKVTEVFSKDVAEVFKTTASRAHVRFHDSDYYSNILDFFQNNPNLKAKLYIAEHENDLLAANLNIYYGDTMTYLFGGSSDIKRNFMGTYLLHWHAIREAKSEGFKRYDFWGVEEDPNHPWHGFSRFKLGFGGEVIRYAGAYDLVLNRAWYNTYTILRKLNRIVRK